ncbi:GNAT family N-acetyltransferase [Ruminococcus albus]|nr:GNAT family N-acetyltransferase [Ruminococcus albus]MCC3351820.1 GNAT family N-acetyltransferase [Ruminococcus albus 8]
MKILSKAEWSVQCEMLSSYGKIVDNLVKEKKEHLETIQTYKKVCELLAAHKNYRLYTITNIKDKNSEASEIGRDTMVILVDRRKEVSNDSLRNYPINLNAPVNNGGEIELYAINSEMYYSIMHETELRIKSHVPYIEASFDYSVEETTVRIDEFHSRVSFYDYRGKGYGSLLLDSMVSFLKDEEKKKNPSMPIRFIGMLSYVDIDKEKDIEIRNGFYERKGFKLKNMSKDGKNGKIEAMLEDIKTKSNYT